MKRVSRAALLSLSALLVPLGACDGQVSDLGDSGIEVDKREENLDVYRYANGCYAIRESGGRFLARRGSTSGYDFVAGGPSAATPFRMQPADLATYLLYDADRGYVTSQGSGLSRATQLRSDQTEQVDRYTSEAEWVLEDAGAGPDEFRLRHRKSDGFLSTSGVRKGAAQAAALTLVPASGCVEHPELTLDAEGAVQKRTFADGAVWGIVEPHTHVMSNFGFGGGGVFHGAPFHRLGVEHALGDCKATHGLGGARDLFGNVFENKITNPDFIFGDMLAEILAGRPQGLFHETAGYPKFTDWPAGPFSSTHQVQYYKWIERAYLGGLRLMVQDAVSNSVICELSQGLGLQTPRHGCADMAQVDREIEEIYGMERYIDAQAGGPGKGFFRIVTSPAQAREVILDGKLAVLLGIETSNLFDCMLNPRPGMPTCDEAFVERTLDEYHRRGIRALFPVHKFDNAFGAGDGSRDFIEIGNFINSGHHSDYVTEGCPGPGAGFDKGDIAFSGINRPRNDFDAPAPYNMSYVSKNAVLTLAPHVPKLLRGAAQGEFCQKHGFTRLGEFLLREMMKRGMIIEIDHLPQHSYWRAIEMFTEYNYPPAATHGSTGYGGKVYELGGISKTNVGGCRDPNNKGATLGGLRDRIALKKAKGAYPGEAWSWDLNGFAGVPGPRFGSKSGCTNQSDPVTYPFKSVAGDVTFTQPRVGNRVLDFNTEGLVHIGLLPEFVDELRRDANSDEELEPLFRSAEAYLRMWEKAERRSTSIRAWGDDDCPFDDDKLELGICGCGVADTDGDGDGTADCNDRCGDNPSKTSPGLCGCGATDDDADSDGVPDCYDLCPGDPDKLDTGVCGCGAAEADADGDGVQNCHDLCPRDVSKLAPGACGCSVADTDSDGDGTADCTDNCPADPGKATPGTCGCGTPDSDRDGDGTVDCNDRCPSDPGKVFPGECGCGVAEGKCGLVGQYFRTRHLTSHGYTRRDDTINFDWGRGSPAPGIADHEFSIRWEGYVQAVETGEYTFYTVTDDGVRLWVNGQQLVDQWRDIPKEEHSGRIHLQAGQRYPIRMEYYEHHWDATCKLLWSGPGVPKQIIPKNRLSSP